MNPVALVYPYFRERDPVQKLFPPLGILHLASQLRERGVPVRIFDCTFRTPGEVVEEIVAANPSVIAGYVMVTMTANAFALVRELRTRLPDTLFVAGGPLPTVYPHRFSGSFDIVFRGEADLTFARFCHDYLAAGCGPSQVSGLPLATYPGIYRNGPGGTAIVPPIHHPKHVLDALPLPDRRSIDNGRYQAFWQEIAGCKPTSIMVTRGCPFTCDFCSKPVWGNLFRKPSLDRVFREVEDIASLGYDRLWIADDSFTLDLGYLRAFCRELIRRDLPLTWTCLSRVDRLEAKTAALMRQAGCVRVYLGLESGSDATLRLMGKRTTVADGVRAVRIFREAGIESAGFFMVGYPGESVESIEQTLSHALTLDLSEVSINVPYPLPGSPLFNRVAELQTDRDWESAGEVTFLYRSEFDEGWLRGRITETMQQAKNRQSGIGAGGDGETAGMLASR
jgi:anaerobic magnesium-protoporphyrin IX monomethyl ester cyclase